MKKEIAPLSRLPLSGHQKAEQFLLNFDGRHGHQSNTEHMFRGHQRDEEGIVNLHGMRGRETIVISHYRQFGGSRCTCGGFLDDGVCTGCHRDYLYN